MEQSIPESFDGIPKVRFQGAIRYVDSLGRVVIPKDFRRTQGIEAGDQVEMFCLKDGSVFMRKWNEPAPRRAGSSGTSTR